MALNSESYQIQPIPNNLSFASKVLPSTLAEFPLACWRRYKTAPDASSLSPMYRALCCSLAMKSPGGSLFAGNHNPGDP